MRISRDGHLCWKTSTAPEFPDSILEEGKDLCPKAPVIKQGQRYYLQRNWVYETYLLEQVKRLRNLSPLPCHDEEIFYRELGQSNLLPMQKDVVKTAFQNAFSLICGGPGTGKTYTASILVKLLLRSKKKEKYKVILAAPTGKAAFHLQSVLKEEMESTTLHRLLKVVQGKNRLFSNRKLDADLVIVDEASMIDVPLLAQLLESIGDHTRLVLMGDPDQLPPVEAGSLFAEMAALFSTPLKKSMRTELSCLQLLGEEINRGEFTRREHLLNWPFDSDLSQKLFEALNPVISWQEPDPQLCLNQINQFRVLGALRQGPYGIDALNQKIVAEMSARICPGQWWAIPIMITTNEPSQNLYNGTCGILIGKSRGRVHLRDGTAYFPEKIPFRFLPRFEIAFCLSIHKSQGSEFEKVLALFPEGSDCFGREALYTAVTRAKKEVQIVAVEGVIQAMLAQRSRKISGFTERYTYSTESFESSLAIGVQSFETP